MKLCNQWWTCGILLSGVRLWMEEIRAWRKENILRSPRVGNLTIHLLRNKLHYNITYVLLTIHLLRHNLLCIGNILLECMYSIRLSFVFWFYAYFNNLSYVRIIICALPKWISLNESPRTRSDSKWMKFGSKFYSILNFTWRIWSQRHHFENGIATFSIP